MLQSAMMMIGDEVGTTEGVAVTVLDRVGTEERNVESQFNKLIPTN